jgi:hypothetical protein
VLKGLGSTALSEYAPIDRATNALYTDKFKINVMPVPSIFPSQSAMYT